MNCDQTEAVRDYALDELPLPLRGEVERHITTCEACLDEFRAIQMTASSLRSLPDREIPQRIAFVSDKLFEPSPWVRFFGSFWNSAARLGFVSACVLAGALVFSAAHRPLEVRTVQTVTQLASSQPAGYTKADLDAAIHQAVQQVHEQDSAQEKLALARVEQKYEERQRALMISVDENLQVLQKRLSSYTTLASVDASRIGGQ